MTIQDSLNIAVIEPYYGGSHKAFVDSFIAHSRHACTLVTLPARKWKWRMRGAAIYLTRDHNEWTREPLDVIFCSDMLSVSDLRALLPPALRSIPIVCYFHENQLTYPLSPGDRKDYQYGMTNITSCLAADQVWFNSDYHREAFLGAAASLLDKMPDFVPAKTVESIRAKSHVLPPGVDVAVIEPDRPSPSRPPRILWCHRWEYDKNPEPFFAALLDLDEAGCCFELVVLGEQFRTAPDVFAESWPRLATHIVHAGFCADRRAYLELLSTCDLVVSTAIQENFGIAICEAILAGCAPLLPNRLSYPELIPPGFHERCLYDTDEQMRENLRDFLAGKDLLPRDAMRKLQQSLSQRFAPKVAVAAMDESFALITVESLRAQVQ